MMQFWFKVCGRKDKRHARPQEVRLAKKYNGVGKCRIAGQHRGITNRI